MGMAEATWPDNEGRSDRELHPAPDYLQQGRQETTVRNGLPQQGLNPESPSGTEDAASETEFARVVAAMEARGWTYIGTTEMGMPFFAQTPSGTEGETFAQTPSGTEDSSADPGLGGG